MTRALAVETAREQAFSLSRELLHNARRFWKRLPFAPSVEFSRTPREFTKMSSVSCGPTRPFPRPYDWRLPCIHKAERYERKGAPMIDRMLVVVFTGATAD